MSTAPRNSGVRWSGRTHPGRVRPHNEDAFIALVLNEREVRYLGKDGEAEFTEGDFIFAVADGMGGAKAGEYASKIAVEQISRRLPASFREQGANVRRNAANLLKQTVAEIHGELRRMAFHYEECRGMGATLSLCWLSPDRLVFTHVGDSRIYYLGIRRERSQLTEDQSAVGRLFRKGLINEREARNHPRRHILEMSLGGHRESVRSQEGSVIPIPGDRFVLTTDGVQDGVFDANLEGMIRSPSHLIAHLPPAERIVREAVSASGKDNITAVVFETF
ncbi:MAG: PP2C family protein-serine/threonine phosphatase [Puniceicoccaceae bacterium]